MRHSLFGKLISLTGSDTVPETRNFRLKNVILEPEVMYLRCDCVKT